MWLGEHGIVIDIIHTRDGLVLNEVINRAVRWGFNQDEDLALMIIRDPPAGARTDNGDVIPDVVVFPQHFPTPQNPNPDQRSLDDFDFLSILFEVLTGDGDVFSEQNQKHIWWHNLEYTTEDGEGVIKKNIYNAHNNDIQLSTHTIKFDRISDVQS